jgi:putative tricarboxylic transport membrane protein
VPGGVSDEEYDAWVERLRAVGTSEAWVAARQQARLRPYFLVGEEFEAFVMEQVDEFTGLARDLGLIR